jgi:hypothetical protein
MFPSAAIPSHSLLYRGAGIVQKYRLLGLVVLIAGIASACWALTRPFSRPHFTKEQSDQIHVGMTEAEVVGVLDRPAGNYTSGPDVVYLEFTPAFWDCPEGKTEYDGSVMKGWMSDSGCVGVLFNSDGKVVFCYWVEVWIKEPESPLDHALWALRRLLG